MFWMSKNQKEKSMSYETIDIKNVIAESEK